MADTLSTLKTAYDLAKDLVNLHDTTIRQGKVAELQRQILDAQQSAIDANLAVTDVAQYFISRGCDTLNIRNPKDHDRLTPNCPSTGSSTATTIKLQSSSTPTAGEFLVPDLIELLDKGHRLHTLTPKGRKFGKLGIRTNLSLLL